MKHEKLIRAQRTRRRFRVRNRIKRDATRPRLSVFRSVANIYCQIIDDASGRTLAAASSVDADVKSSLKYGGNKVAAQAVGKVIAERAKAAGVTAVAFDRGNYKYHGRVAALAEAAREAGLQL